MQLKKYSFGIGDRFARNGEAQLKAFIDAQKKGVNIIPVWNKSNREHLTINSEPSSTRAEADNAMRNLNWKEQYFVDADHINMDSVDRFIDSSDFFTIDVAGFIGKKVPETELVKFVESYIKFEGDVNLPGTGNSIKVNKDILRAIGEKFQFAIKEAAKIYWYIESRKGRGRFITEISMDEVDETQSPTELFFILASLSAEKIPVQTIAPKFSGRFNKGVDYQGDIAKFEKEFKEDLMVIDLAVKEFGLPSNLKLSIHSGSDKFSIYPVIGSLIRKYDKGIHIKTAGTTWLEEMTGLALAGGDALELARTIYCDALDRFDELCSPYATVIDIDKSRLPTPAGTGRWDGRRFASALRHDPGNPVYNPHMRQLVHVAYKIAAEKGDLFTSMLEKHRDVIAVQVTENIYNRHMVRLFDL